jgi:hypothetical protein
MKNKKVLAIIGILVFSVLVGISTYVVVNKKVYLPTKADPQVTPRKVKITNISENSFSVSWYTDKPTTAFIKYGEKPSSLNKTLALEDHEDKTIKRSLHHFTLKNLRPQRTYYFKINSNGTEFGQTDGKTFSQLTPAVISTAPPPPDPVYGKISDAFGSPLTEPAIIYLDLKNTTPISTITKTDGSWAIALNNARSNDLTAYSQYDPENEIINILVLSKGGQTTKAVTNTSNDTPVPTIKLGAQNNFLPEKSPTKQAPETSFTLQTPSPTILPTPTPTTTPSATISEITISLPADKTYTETSPTFKGTAPANTTIEITIQSNEVVTGTIKTDANGNWIFTPDTPLSPGEHTITLTFTNLNGKKIEKTFTFSVLGEQTESLPDAGVPTPTILLLILGIMAFGGFFTIPLFSSSQSTSSDHE